MEVVAVLLVASIFVSVEEEPFATHTELPTIANASGPSPTGMVAATVSVAGLMRETVLSSPFATHTEPNPKVIAVGPEPTEICTGGPPCGSIRVISSSAGSLTQTEPAPRATPKGGVLTCFVETCPELAFTSARVPAVASATQMAP